MTIERYWAIIATIFAKKDRPSSDGLSVIWRTHDGTPVSVTNPDGFDEAERIAMID
jgi:hypothetical protein